MSSPATGTAPAPAAPAAPGPAGIGVDAEHEARTRMRFKHWASTFASRHSLPRRRQPRHHSAARTGSGSAAGQRPPRAPRWWKIRLFRGMVNDVRRRAPYYWSDWSDAWDYRVVPATVYMYFANILPALAFSLDMFTKTHMQYGVNEVLLSSVLGAVVFSVLACQPLVIVGVTGPITVFNYTVYDIMKPTGTNFLAFMCWIGLWSVLLHWLLAITNSCNWLRYVTRFPCDIFGFYVAFIYLQKGIQVLERLGDGESFYLSIVVALLVFVVAYVCSELGRGSLFRHSVRVFLKDYGTPLTVVFFTGFVHIGRMRNVPLETLPTSTSFLPTVDRGWLVDFWNISVVDVFLALPFAVLLTILFWFDHNVSSLIAQGTEFPLTKPAGFHWDLFLLGLTTGVAGLLGLPFPNGLIPQAPFHTESLCVTTTTTAATADDGKVHPTGPRATRVVEQRVSNLAQGLLTLGTMTGPLLVVLHLIPQGVLAGLFFIMGFQALEANGITAKLLFLARDAAVFGPSTGQNNNDQLAQLPRRRRRRVVWAFVALELVGFGATFAITQTVAAVGFPVFILALIPVRAALLPRWFDPLELAALDGPTASPFTMESVGGSYGGGEEEDQDGEEGGSVIDAPDGSGSGNDSGETGEGGNGKGKGKGGLFRSDEELAELGEGFPAGMTRRRGSAIGRGEGGGEVVEMARLGANRRSSGHAGRAGV
ncbi:HCO3 transporter family-domain-containing protein [Phialemonium atrogriseum]|uniref:HCO3 transporter family-domain-containing protein n=1 Tax=Phialemonium atrogriseum TaxID=1093897 RepID=A0AAJ0C577_9PEZI|nr:HCO3 transporter family-domain-containing protein [Phialemonium atrogriseum]KAK1770390.1 HCO3 transporter family-domain-containing protein [Phialemonium atrogriseum]